MAGKILLYGPLLVCTEAMTLIIYFSVFSVILVILVIVYRVGAPVIITNYSNRYMSNNAVAKVQYPSVGEFVTCLLHFSNIHSTPDAKDIALRIIRQVVAFVNVNYESIFIEKLELAQHSKKQPKGRYRLDRTMWYQLVTGIREAIRELVIRNELYC